MGVVRVATTPVDSSISDMVCTFFDGENNAIVDVQPCVLMAGFDGVYEARTTTIEADHTDDLWGHITCPSLPRINTINRVYPTLKSVDKAVSAVAVDMAFVRAIEGGRWDIIDKDDSGQQMVFYAEDNSTEVARFDFKDLQGDDCDAEGAFERVRLA